jgi:hypothetical protein
MILPSSTPNTENSRGKQGAAEQVDSEMDTTPLGGVVDPDLETIIAAWPRLPAAIQRAMLSLIGDRPLDVGSGVRACEPQPPREIHDC